MPRVDGYRCVDCDALFEKPGGPIYECSSCGTTQVDERQCSDCHRFMAKQADESCPECEQEGIEPEELWRGADGNLYESEEEERDFVADAPKRAAQKEEHDQLMERHMAQCREEARTKNAALRPLLVRFLELSAGCSRETADDGARLRMAPIVDTVQSALEAIDREPDVSCSFLVTLWVDQLAALVDPEVAASLRQLMRDVLRDYDERDRESAPLIARVVACITEPPELVARLRHAGMGSAPSVELEYVVPGLIVAMEKRDARKKA